MDLNERLAARRKELAEEAEQARLQAQRQRQAELQAIQEAEQARRDALPKPPDPMRQQTPAHKAVDMDEGVQLFKDAVERVTKKQLAIFCVMGVLALIGLGKEPLMAIFWAVCALGYITITIGSYLQDLKKPPQAPNPGNPPTTGQ